MQLLNVDSFSTIQLYIGRNRFIILLSEFVLNWCYDRYAYNIINYSVNNGIRCLMLIDIVECCPNMAMGLVVNGCFAYRLTLLVRPDHTPLISAALMIHSFAALLGAPRFDTHSFAALLGASL